MKIKINTKAKKLNLWIPNGLLLNNFVLNQIVKELHDEKMPMDKDMVYAIVKVISTYVKTHKGFVLVDVVTKDMETIKITF